MSDLTKLTAGTMASGVLISIAFASFMLFIGYPLIAFFAVRHLKGIRHELSTLNETLQNKLSIR